VPEAAVYEDRDPSAGEHDVGAAADARYDGAVNSVAQPQPMQLVPQRHLRFRVSPCLTLHSPESFRRRRRGDRHQMLANVVSYSFAMRTIMLP
jgi:hypothetical protein